MALEDVKTCNNREEARQEIDRIDGEIVRLLAERMAYVAQLALFKETFTEIRQFPPHERTIALVRMVAQEQGVPVDLAAKWFEELIELSLAYEEAVHAALHKT